VFRKVALKLFRGGLPALLLTTLSRVCGADPADVSAPAPADASGKQPSPPPPQLTHWYDLSRLPFLPIPSVGTDPNSGTTVGLLPVWLRTNDNHDITRIIAPDITHNPFFGWGAHARLFAYPSTDEQWSIVAGTRERVERGVDFQYQLGRLHEGKFTSTSDADFDRDGTPRFFGVGNNTKENAQTNYTAQTTLLQEQLGWNLTRNWQLLYTIRKRIVKVLPGTLSSVPSIETLFPHVPGLDTNGELLNRYSVVYDTRDDLTAPRHGTRLVIYGGGASVGGIFNDSLYSEAGGDVRSYWSVSNDTVLATHASLRYLPSARRPLPFWALSSLGGDTSDVGSGQPLRGYGAGRFYDRNEFSANAEIRHVFWGFDAEATHVDLEIAPFLDVGQVFHRTSTFPISNLHEVGGVGFRAIARPSVVGYVDVGYGHEGAAVFTGLNYPF
jgi:outer membrane protein assembly factor BamA